jgi:carbamoyl-phosphate synthase large subunit
MGHRLLVIGAGTGLGNNVIRSLTAGDASFVVVGCHTDRFALKSSLAPRNYVIPSEPLAAVRRALDRIIAREGVDLVIPTSDAQVALASRLRGRLRGRLFLPRPRVIALCQDKYRVSAFLRARGVPAPETYAVSTLRDVPRIFQRLGRGPRVWCRARRGSGSKGALPVTSPAQARSWIQYWRDMRGVPVRSFTLCEFLPGRDFGCQSLWQHGRLVVAKTFERLTYFAGENQPSGTSSVAALARSVVEPRVVDVCARAIRALDPRTSGLYCIDLKEDRRGTPCVTDVNVGRFSLSTPLYDLIGKRNMAAIYVQLALGEPVQMVEEYDAVEGAYLVRDLDTLPRIVHADELFEGLDEA